MLDRGKLRLDIVRSIPDEVAERWQRVTDAATAITAVAESRALHHSIARWQAALVQEALNEGSTWEEIGEALGTTRQAAWARFRQAIEPDGGASAMNENVNLREQLRNLWQDAQSRRREADARWREAQGRLRNQLQESQNQLREAKRHNAAERRAAREELRRSADALRSASSRRDR
jgi:hypothetical protein